MSRQYFITGTAAPATTPEFEGVTFIDTTNDRVYISTGISSSADWQLSVLNLSELTIDTDLALGGVNQIQKAKSMEYQPSSEIVISSGAVTQTQTLQSIDTEGDAAADDLDTLTVLTNANVCILKLENTARIVTLKHGTGNLNLPNSTDVIMSFNILYFMVYDGTDWNLVGDTATSGSTLPVVDGTSLVKGSIDPTKLARLEVDTNVPTGTVIVISAPSSDLDMNDIVKNTAAVSDNALARYDATGKLIQGSGLIVDDSDNLSGVAKISTVDHLEVTEIAAPSTPATGKVAVYAKAGGALYIKDDTGTETNLTTGGGGGSGDVVGPGSAVDENIAVFDSTTGKLIKDGLINKSAITANTAKLTADETNVVAALDGATLSAVTVATGDKVVVQDVSDSDNLKTVTAQSIADLATGITAEEAAAGTDRNETGTTDTLVLTDADNKTVWMNNAASNVVTIPTNASVAFPTGTKLTVMQEGAGETTVTGDTGVTVNGVSAGSKVISAQYGGVVLQKRATNTWIVTG